MVHWITMSLPVAENYAEKLSEFLIPLSSAFFIFVLGATFILLQENYHKFNSTVFFRYIVRRCIPSIVISILLLAASFVVQLFSIGKGVFILGCVLSLLLGSFSCLWILFGLRQFLDYQYLIKRVLIQNVKQRDVDAYVAGDISEKENCIDSSLKLVLGAINNDIIATEGVFKSIFEWFYNNWERFDLGKANNQQNKFGAFLIAMDESVLACDSFSIQANYLNAIYNVAKKVEMFTMLDYKKQELN